MLSLMVLHWGTVSQIVTIDCNAQRGRFPTKPKSGSFCAGQDIDTIPLYEYQLPQTTMVLN